MGRRKGPARAMLGVLLAVDEEARIKASAGDAPVAEIVWTVLERAGYQLGSRPGRWPEAAPVGGAPDRVRIRLTVDRGALERLSTKPGTAAGRVRDLLIVAGAL